MPDVDGIDTASRDMPCGICPETIAPGTQIWLLIGHGWCHANCAILEIGPENIDLTPEPFPVRLVLFVRYLPMRIRYRLTGRLR